ncbi:hypothetical protein ABPG72_015064 [Tetrahymena utriculariae]
MRKDIGKDDYKYLFFIDFKCNNSNNIFEIKEFPLHVVDVTSKELIESFVSYVKPRIQNAPILQEVLKNVQNFLEKYLEAGIDKFAVVYECDSDSSFLFSETSKKKIKLPPIFEKYICLKSVFPIEIAKKAPQSLQQMLQQLKMEFQGQQHCEADYSKSQARVGLKLQNQVSIFPKIKKYNQESQDIQQQQQQQQQNPKNLNEKNKQNTQNSKSNKRQEIESSFEDAFWQCKECNAKIKWKYNKICLTCNSNKYKSYDRMRKDIGQNDYQYLFFIDFECNYIYNTFEIIEFPLHVVDVTSKEVIDSFVSYVKPSNKIINFRTKLTKITNDPVQNAPILEQVLINVQNFLKNYLEAGIDKCAVVYDCDSDSRFLFSETSKKKIKVPEIFEKYFYLKSVFPIKITKKAPQSLQQRLQQLKMEFQGQQHCGADDSMNQARVGLKLLELGYNFSKDQKLKLGESSTNISKEQQMKQCNMYKKEYLIQKQQNKQIENNNN